MEGFTVSATRLTTLDIFKLTAKTNCGECGAPACMAFAAMVLSGLRKTEDCPYFDPEQTTLIAQKIAEPTPDEGEHAETISELKKKVSAIDLASVADRLGGEMSKDRLSVHCLGRLFEIDARGEMYAECHVNYWVHLAVLNYIVNCKGREPSDDWVPFRELEDAKTWELFFNHRCEKAMHKIADQHTDLFFDVLDLFGRKITDEATDADHSIVMYPLPKVPFLIRYWEPDGAFESKLSLLFDSTNDDNLAAEATFMLSSGILEMFTKIIAKHSTMA
jgi:Domain of unknown function (DUF3786)/Putative Fe-S cluster